MALINTTNISAANDPVGILVAANQATGDVVGISIVLAIGAITYFSLSNNYDFENSLITSSFIMSLCAILLGGAGILSDSVIIPIIALTGAIGFYMVMKR